MFLAADGILIKSTMGGFVILGSKLLGRFYNNVSNFLSVSGATLKSIMSRYFACLSAKRAK